MWRVALAALSVLSACGAPVGDRPERVLVERDRITVIMSDGWPCTGFRTAETRTQTGWAGRLEGCPATHPYQVRLADGARPSRQVLVLSDGARRGGTEVQITGGPKRNWVFQAP